MEANSLIALQTENAAMLKSQEEEELSHLNNDTERGEITFKRNKIAANKTSSTKQTSINSVNMLNNTNMNERNANKPKLRRNRELGDLNDNQILSARLRSSSGKVYSSSLSVDAGSQPSSPTGSLSSLVEDNNLLNSAKDTTVNEMCPQEECCRGTSKLMEMMTKMQKSLDGVLKKTTTQEILVSNSSHKIQDLQDQMDRNETDIDDIEKELKETKFQLQVVTNIVIKQDEQISFLKNKIADIQQREMAPNVVITGIPELKNERPIQLFNTFVTKQLEIQELIPANKAFRIGSGLNRPLIVELRHPESKGKLFANATKLKGKKNESGGFYFLSDHLPEERNEIRRRANELIAENRKKQASHRLDMSISRGKLIINEEPYQKAVTAPTARDLLEPDDSLFDKAEELDIVRGDDDVKAKSKFISYAAAVQDFADVQAALTKLRMKFADATHVSCAYRLPGANTPKNQDYVDDGEHGCGRTMLKVLREEKYMNVAVFIVRYFGGSHLGVARFDIFRNLAKSAVKILSAKRKSNDTTERKNIPSEQENQPSAAAPFQQDGPEVVEEWHHSDSEDWSTAKKSI